MSGIIVHGQNAWDFQTLGHFIITRQRPVLAFKGLETSVHGSCIQSYLMSGLSRDLLATRSLLEQ